MIRICFCGCTTVPSSIPFGSPGNAVSISILSIDMIQIRLPVQFLLPLQTLRSSNGTGRIQKPIETIIFLTCSSPFMLEVSVVCKVSSQVCNAKIVFFSCFLFEYFDFSIHFFFIFIFLCTICCCFDSKLFFFQYLFSIFDIFFISSFLLLFILHKKRLKNDL